MGARKRSFTYDTHKNVVVLPSFQGLRVFPRGLVRIARLGQATVSEEVQSVDAAACRSAIAIAGLTMAAVGDRHGEVVECGSSLIEGDSVEGEEDESTEQTGARVAIDKRMILLQVEQVGRGHRPEIRMQPLPTEARHGLGDCRLQCLAITQAGGPAIAGKHLDMEIEHIIDREELGRHSARRLRVASWISIFRCAAARTLVEWS